jgi:hypothetical protein
MENKIFFRTWTGHEHGYDKTFVRVYRSKAQSVDELIEGCIDNKAGYGDVSAAARIREQYQTVKDAGYLAIVDTPLYEPSVTLAWLHSTYGSYCRPHVSAGDTFESIEMGMTLLRHIAKRARKYGEHPNIQGPGRALDIQHPEAVLKALKAMKKNAQEVEVFQRDAGYIYFHVFGRTESKESAT